MKILIIKTSSLGDIVRTFITVKELKENFNNCEIHWAVKEKFKDIFEFCDFVDKLIVIPDNFFKGIISYYRQVKNYKYDYIIDYQGLIRTGILCFLTKSKRKIGYSNPKEKIASFFYTHKYKIGKRYWESSAVERIINLTKAEFKSINFKNETLTFPALKQEKSIIEKFDLKHKKYIGLCVDSNWETRCWPEEYFFNLSKLLYEKLNIISVFIGTNKNIKIEETGYNINLINKTGLQEAVVILKNALCIVSPDTGLLHIFDIFKGPEVIGLYGASGIQRAGFYYQKDRHKIIKKDLECVPCEKKYCEYKECMYEIYPMDVFKEILKILEKDENEYITEKAIFLDRDGTINKDPGYINQIEDVVFYEDVFDFLNFAKQKGYKIIIITNQAGIGRGYITEEQLKKVNDKILKEIEYKGCRIDGLYYSPYYENSKNKKYRLGRYKRKPNPGMLFKAANDFLIDIKKSFMIGDRLSDIKAGKLAGCRTILVLTGDGMKTKERLDNELIKPDYIAQNLTQAKDIINKTGE